MGEGGGLDQKGVDGEEVHAIAQALDEGGAFGRDCVEIVLGENVEQGRLQRTNAGSARSVGEGGDLADAGAGTEGREGEPLSFKPEERSFTFGWL